MSIITRMSNTKRVNNNKKKEAKRNHQQNDFAKDAIIENESPRGGKYLVIAEQTYDLYYITYWKLFIRHFR